MRQQGFRKLLQLKNTSSGQTSIPRVEQRLMHNRILISHVNPHEAVQGHDNNNHLKFQVQAQVSAVQDSQATRGQDSQVAMLAQDLLAA